MEEIRPDTNHLAELLQATMPFGKYKDRRLLDLPEEYLVWFRQKGLPPGKLGALMEEAYEIKLNGLEELVKKRAVDRNP